MWQFGWSSTFIRQVVKYRQLSKRCKTRCQVRNSPLEDEDRLLIPCICTLMFLLLLCHLWSSCTPSFILDGTDALNFIWIFLLLDKCCRYLVMFFVIHELIFYVWAVFMYCSLWKIVDDQMWHYRKVKDLTEIW